MRLAGPLALAGTIVAAGFGAFAGAEETSAAASASQHDSKTAAKRARGTLIKTETGGFGRILVNGNGKAVYYFTLERGRKARCYRECARAWPPVLAHGRPRAGSGAKQGLLGTTRRRNHKRQVTYKGHPLYYYEQDTSKLTLCHDVFEFGGRWLLLKPSGKRVS